MKSTIFLICLLATMLSCKEKNTSGKKTQTDKIKVENQGKFTDSFKTQFAGTWQKETEFQTNTLEIQFEPGKNYATVIDSGSGEAPPIKLKALPKDNKLFINTENEHIQLEVKNNELIFRIQPATLNKDGTTQKPRETVFKKVRK